MFAGILLSKMSASSDSNSYWRFCRYSMARLTSWMRLSLLGPSPNHIRICYSLDRHKLYIFNLAMIVITNKRKYSWVYLTLHDFFWLLQKSWASISSLFLRSVSVLYWPCIHHSIYWVSKIIDDYTILLFLLISISHCDEGISEIYVVKNRQLTSWGSERLPLPANQSRENVI